jgi:hypothetical protein
MEEIKTITQAEKKPPRGGNIILFPGKGAKDRNDVAWPDGSFIFQLADGTEMMRFEPGGKVVIRGQEVDDNAEVYKAFREWFMHGNIRMAP